LRLIPFFMRKLINASFSDPICTVQAVFR